MQNADDRGGYACVGAGGAQETLCTFCSILL